MLLDTPPSPDAPSEAPSALRSDRPRVDPSALRRFDELPGPRGWPIVGNAFGLDRSRIHAQVEAWRHAYGPTFRFRVGGRRLLVVADHEAVAAALRDRPDGFRRTRTLERIGTEMGLKPGVFGANGGDWRRQRRMVMAGFDPTHVRAYFPALRQVAVRLRGRWERAAREGAAIDLQADLMRFTVDAIAGLAFGSAVNTLESEADVIQQHLDKIFPALSRRMLSLVPWWRWFPSAADRELERSMQAVDAAIDGFIAAARDRLAADPARRERPPNLLEAMLVAAAADASITDAEVAGNVMTMLLAGEDTTANTLAWMIWLLHRHPQALARARDEVRALGVGAEAFTSEQIAGLAYVEACAHETMRLRPVAPFQVIEALRATTIAGVAVPAGTLVWLVMRGDSVDERYFSDAAAFRPERWLDESAGAASAAKRISMPFGAGPRVCPGRYLALQEIRLALAMLLAHFEIDAVSAPGGVEPAERMAFTMYPEGLTMQLRAF